MDECRSVTFILPDKSDLIITGVPNGVFVHEIKAKLASIKRIQEINHDIILKVNNVELGDDDLVSENIIYIEEKPIKPAPMLVILYSFLIIVSLVGLAIAYICRFSEVKKFLVYIIPLTLYAVLGYIWPPPEELSLSGAKGNIIIDVFVLFIRSLNPKFRLEHVLLN